MPPRIIVPPQPQESDQPMELREMEVRARIVGRHRSAGRLRNGRGILLAVLALQFLSSGLNLLQVHEFAGPYVNHFTKEFTRGALLLFVMVLHRGARRTEDKRRTTEDRPRTDNWEL
jgi:ribose/xylose/arabinose/galactoside ABC-type transport system permease subunit